MTDPFVGLLFFFFSQLIAHLDRNVDNKIIWALCGDKFCSFRQISGGSQHVLCVPVVFDWEAEGVALQARLRLKWSLSSWLEPLLNFSRVCQHNVSSTVCIWNEGQQSDCNCGSLIDDPLCWLLHNLANSSGWKLQMWEHEKAAIVWF